MTLIVGSWTSHGDELVIAPDQQLDARRRLTCGVNSATFDANLRPQLELETVRD